MESSSRQAIHRLKGWPTVAIFLMWCALLGLLHGWYGTAFPPPWDDEIHFAVPADEWARTGHLSAAQSLNSRGIFWIPSTYYLFDGLVFRLTGTSTLDTARWMSFGEICAAAWCLFLVLVELQRPSAQRWALFAAMLWTLTTPIQLTANFARPDALSISVGLLTLLMFLRRRYAVVLSLATISLTIHPLQAIPAVLLAALALLDWRRCRFQRIDLTAVVFGFGLVAVEGRQYIDNAVLYSTHFAYQLHRKNGRGLDWKIVSCVFALIGLLSSAAWSLFVSRRLLDRDAQNAGVALSGLGYLFVYFYGREMAYTQCVYTGVFLLLVAGLRPIDRVSMATELVTERRWIGPVTACLAGIIFVVGSWGWAFRAGRWAHMPVTSPAMLSRIEEDQLALRNDRRLTVIASREDALVDPTLYGLIIPGFGPGKPRTYSPLSEAVAPRRLHAYVSLLHRYPDGPVDEPPIDVLKGYACKSTELVVTPHRTYIALIRVIQPTPQPTAFKDCDALAAT